MNCAQKKTPRGAATHNAGHSQDIHSIAHVPCFVKRKDEKHEIMGIQSSKIYI